MLAGGIGFIFLGKKLIDGIMDPFGTKDKPKVTATNISTPEQLPVNTAKTTRSKEHFQRFADELAEEMNKFTSGVEYSWIETFNSYTPEDLKALYKAFGVRENTSVPGFSFTGDLLTWFDREYDTWTSFLYYKELKKAWAKTGLW